MSTEVGGWSKRCKVMSTWLLNGPLPQTILLWLFFFMNIFSNWKLERELHFYSLGILLALTMVICRELEYDLEIPLCSLLCKYRKSSNISRFLMQVYSIRSQTTYAYSTPKYYQNFTFRAFLGSLGVPLLPLEKFLI